MDQEIKIKAIFGSISSIFSLLTVILFRYLEVTAEKAIMFPLRVPEIFFGQPNGLQYQELLFNILSEVLVFIVTFIPLTIGLAILALYGSKYGADKKLALAAQAPVVLIGLFVFNFSIVSVLIMISLIIVSLLVTGYGETYNEETKRWNNFRTGTKTIGKAFLIITIFLMFGILGYTSINVEHFESEIQDTTEGILANFMEQDLMNEAEQEAFSESSTDQELQELEEFDEEMIEQEQNMTSEIREEIEDEIYDSQMFTRFVQFYLFSSAFFIGGIVFFLAKIIYGPISGFVTLLNRLL